MKSKTPKQLKAKLPRVVWHPSGRQYASRMLSLRFSLFTEEDGLHELIETGGEVRLT
jgi:hypothetical protein